jgi:predicted nucleic acid-binding protein
MIALLFDRVRIMQPERQYGAQARLFSPDPDDVAYFALALQLRCPLWSNDKRLKEQNEVHVLTTTELAALLAEN